VTGLTGLVITLEYPEHQFQGPPFSVREPELRARYGANVEELGSAPDERVPGRDAIERCFAVGN
jgi:hypothetical protein